MMTNGKRSIRKKHIHMTVLETDTPTRQPLLLPFDRDPSRKSGGFELFCPNIAGLDLPYFQKAEQHLQEMVDTLRDGESEAFNESRRHLMQLLRKHGEPIAQWNPLVLEFANENLLKGASLSHVDFTMTRLRSVYGVISLEGACLQGAGFLCADLREVILRDADLTGADLRFADMAEADLTGALLIEAKLGGARLAGTCLQKANLYCANLSGANLRHALLEEANLRKADLRQTDCCRTNLRHARLQQADLREGNFLMADLTGAKLRHADLRKTYLGFCCLREARFQNARLHETDFSGADLTLADFQKCRFTSVTFGRAVMAGATMKGTEFQEVCLAECCELDSANLQDARFDEATSFPPDFRPECSVQRTRPMNAFHKLVRMLGSFRKRQLSASLTEG